jgi:hypothetical protein
MFSVLLAAAWAGAPKATYATVQKNGQSMFFSIKYSTISL